MFRGREMIRSSVTLPGRTISWTLFKYIVKDIFFSFLVAFLFFFFCFFVNQLLLMAQEILTKKVPLLQVALLIFYSLPSIIAMAMPFASLMGTLMTIGRLTSDNEVLIMLTAGLSYRMIFLPALVVGSLISIFSFITNDVLLPAGTIQFSRLYRRILVSTPALELEANSVKRFKDTVIVTGPVAGGGIDNILIMDRTSEGERRVIMANNARLIDEGRDGLNLDLRSAFIQSSKEVVKNDYDYASAGLLSYWIPQEDIMQAVPSISPREMSSRDVRREIGVKELSLLDKIDERGNRLLTQALNLEMSLRNGPSNEAWNRRESNYTAFKREYESLLNIQKDQSLHVYRLEYYKKFSIPFGALSFVLLAVSLGLMGKKSGQTVGFIFGVIISVIYWALLFGGQTMGIRLGYSSFWSMWMPNLLAVSIGFVLFIVRILK